MISRDTLKQMCSAPGPEKPFYRPFICNGDLSKADIFFIGINPATPIYPDEMDLDSYVDLLLNYEDFMDYYKQNRIRQGKQEITRTRQGMNSFFAWLSKHTNSAILETDVIPFPTANEELLKKEPQHVKEKGKAIFYTLIKEFKPSLLILHGSETVEQALKILNGLIEPTKVDIKQPLKVMEKRSPLVQIKYSNGEIGAIMACRHFLHYGIKGDSYETFRQNVLNILSTFKT